MSGWAITCPPPQLALPTPAPPEEPCAYLVAEMFSCYRYTDKGNPAFQGSFPRFVPIRGSIVP